MSNDMTRTKSGTDLPTRLLGVYLNDHLAGATGGVELMRRAASAQRSTADGPTLDRLAAEIAADRSALLDMMIALDIPVRHYKVYAAWVMEKAGRLKFNGRLSDRSPLSDLVEFEALWLGVHGKMAVWRVLRALADRDDRLDAARLEELISRASRQAETLAELRSRTAIAVFRAAA